MTTSCGASESIKKDDYMTYMHIHMKLTRLTDKIFDRPIILPVTPILYMSILAFLSANGIINETICNIAFGLLLAFTGLLTANLAVGEKFEMIKDKDLVIRFLSFNTLLVSIAVLVMGVLMTFNIISGVER